MFYLVQWLAWSYWKSVNSNCLVHSMTQRCIQLSDRRIVYPLKFNGFEIVKDVFHILMDFLLKTAPNVKRGRANLFQQSNGVFVFVILDDLSFDFFQESRLLCLKVGKLRFLWKEPIKILPRKCLLPAHMKHQHLNMKDLYANGRMENSQDSFFYSKLVNWLL